MSESIEMKGGVETVKGRPPVPTAIKKAKGTYRKDRVVANEAKFVMPKEMPKPPSYLNTFGKKLWKLLGELLLERGLFSEGDALAFEMLCDSYGIWRVAMKDLKVHGLILESEKGYRYVNPANGVKNTAWAQMQKMLGQFGLTPAERTRVMASLSEDKMPKRKELAEMLFEGIEKIND